jgi:hypothetical protein
MALYFLYSKSNVPMDRIEGTLRQALDDKDSSVVFAALSIWKLILVVSSQDAGEGSIEDIKRKIYIGSC